MNKITKFIIIIIGLFVVACLLKYFTHINGILAIIFCPMLIIILQMTEYKTSLYAKWIIATLTPTLYYPLVKSFKSDLFLPYITWALIGAVMTLVVIFSMKHRIQKAE